MHLASSAPVLRPATRRWVGLARLLLALPLLGASAFAERMQLTDILGRSITAEPLALQGDKLTIRREDGRVFELSLANLIDDDQARIREWAKTAPPAPPPVAEKPAPAPASEPPKATASKPERPATDPTKLKLTYSRFKAETRTLAKFEGYSHQHEMWGYSLQVANRNLYPAENVRLEYNVFARTLPESSTPTVITGSFDLPPIDSSRSETVRTRTAEVCKRKGYYTANSGGELRGIWVKVFLDGKMIHEEIAPESLRGEESWNDPAKSPQVQRRGVIVDGYYY